MLRDENKYDTKRLTAEFPTKVFYFFLLDFASSNVTLKAIGPLKCANAAMSHRGTAGGI